MNDRANRAGGAGAALRVAIVAPPWYEVPPDGYGGIERLCYDLTEALVDRGHDVTLIATGRDRTRARFLQAYPEPPIGLGGIEHPVQEVRYGARVTQLRADLDVDVVHDHSLGGPLGALGHRTPTLITAHGPAHTWVGDYYRKLGLPIVAVSEAQRVAAPDLPWVGTVVNALDVDEYPYEPIKDDFVLFMGRFSPEKGVHLAPDACRAAGLPLILAGKCGADDERRYFDEEIRHRLGPDAEWIGEAEGERRKTLLSRARCLLCPVRWEEPFGLVSIEALACGTPVVALRRGALAEIVEPGRTGFLCDDPADLPALLLRAAEIDPRECREAALRRFHRAEMARGYEEVYRALLAERGS
jgi:glycosyltransferase involved in cell wall biosynthesis